MEPLPRMRVATSVSGLADAVFAHRSERRRSSLYGGLVVALALHAGVLLWARGMQGRAPAPVRAREPDTEVELEPPVAPPPPPEQSPEPPAHVESQPNPAPRPRIATHAARTPSPPAQAAAVIAQEPKPNAPLDFSATDFVTGTASAYAGGVTATSGTSRHAATRTTVQPAASGSGRGTGSHAKPVMLALDEWQCPWPHEAEQEQIDEQTVTLRALVAADGHARSVTLLADPGYGFGAAARACALLTRFAPAMDEHDRVIQAWSPPIRVHFTR